MFIALWQVALLHSEELMPTGLFTLRQQNQALRQGAWTGPQKTTWVEYLVVAGGGAGAGVLGNGGGGGGGGLLTGILPVATGSSITATVGAGGADTNPAAKGGSSVFGSITATGGGQGVSFGGFPTTGNNGGSGGGGPPNDAVYFVSGVGITGQGNNGGNGLNGGRAAGGGGGAGTVGLSGNISPAVGGNGGAGIASSINGTVTVYAGGGGGMSNATGGSGGVGGGGAGGIFGTTSGTAGTTNRGGGGGADGFGTLGASGGSGIVIIRYPSTFADAASVTNGTKTTANGYTIYTFLTSGSITL